MLSNRAKLIEVLSHMIVSEIVKVFGEKRLFVEVSPIRVITADNMLQD